MRTIDNINHLNKSDFLSIFGNVFEKTESIASEAFESKPFKNFEDISIKMLNIYESYKKDKIEVIFTEKFLPRRGRINCSMQDKDGWRWFGTQFTLN